MTDHTALELVSAQPLKEHLEAWFASHPSESINLLSVQVGTNHHVITEIISGEKTQINICLADKLLMMTEGFLSHLYPVDV